MPGKNTTQTHRAEKVWVEAWCGKHNTMLLAGPWIDENRQMHYDGAICPMQTEGDRRQCHQHWFFKVTIDG